MRTLLIACLLLATSPALAQNAIYSTPPENLPAVQAAPDKTPTPGTTSPNGPTLQQQLTHVAAAVKDAEQDQFITINVENDMFGSGTDRNYTSGVRATYYKMGAEVPQIIKTISKAVPTFSINQTTGISWSVGQNIFTPQDITSVTQPPGDRPWAGFLYGSAALSTVTKNHIDNLEITLGVVGPPSLAEPIQKFIHKNISDSPAPRGWGNQLRTEPGLMLSWERRWPELYHFETLGWSGGFAPDAGATIGNIYTYANAGISAHLSPYAGRWQADPIRVRPSQPSSGAFIVPDRTFSWYLFGGLEGRAVARNIFLDGSTFGESYSVDKKPFVADATAGAALTYGKIRVSYAAVYRTKEFNTQDGGELFGSISVGVRF